MVVIIMGELDSDDGAAVVQELRATARQLALRVRAGKLARDPAARREAEARWRRSFDALDVTP